MKTHQLLFTIIFMSSMSQRIRIAIPGRQLNPSSLLSPYILPFQPSFLFHLLISTFLLSIISFFTCIFTPFSTNYILTPVPIEKAISGPKGGKSQPTLSPEMEKLKICREDFEAAKISFQMVSCLSTESSSIIEIVFYLFSHFFLLYLNFQFTMFYPFTTLPSL